MMKQPTQQQRPEPIQSNVVPTSQRMKGQQQQQQQQQQQPTMNSITLFSMKTLILVLLAILMVYIQQQEEYNITTAAEVGLNSKDVVSSSFWIQQHIWYNCKIIDELYNNMIDTIFRNNNNSDWILWSTTLQTASYDTYRAIMSTGIFSILTLQYILIWLRYILLRIIFPNTTKIMNTYIIPQLYNKCYYIILQFILFHQQLSIQQLCYEIIGIILGILYYYYCIPYLLRLRPIAMKRYYRTIRSIQKWYNHQYELLLYSSRLCTIMTPFLLYIWIIIFVQLLIPSIITILVLHTNCNTILSIYIPIILSIHALLLQPNDNNDDSSHDDTNDRNNIIITTNPASTAAIKKEESCNETAAAVVVSSTAKNTTKTTTTTAVSQQQQRKSKRISIIQQQQQQQTSQEQQQQPLQKENVIVVVSANHNNSSSSSSSKDINNNNNIRNGTYPIQRMDDNDNAVALLLRDSSTAISTTSTTSNTKRNCTNSSSSGSSSPVFIRHLLVQYWIIVRMVACIYTIGSQSIPSYIRHFIYLLFGGKSFMTTQLLAHLEFYLYISIIIIPLITPTVVQDMISTTHTTSPTTTTTTSTTTTPTSTKSSKKKKIHTTITTTTDNKNNDDHDKKNHNNSNTTTTPTTPTTTLIQVYYIQYYILPFVSYIYHTISSTSISISTYESYIIIPTTKFISILSYTSFISESTCDYITQLIIHDGRIILIPTIITILIQSYPIQYIFVVYIIYIIPLYKCCWDIMNQTTTTSSLQQQHRTTQQWLQYWILQTIITCIIQSLSSILYWIPLSTTILYGIYVYITILLTPKTISYIYEHYIQLEILYILHFCFGTSNHHSTGGSGNSSRSNSNSTPLIMTTTTTNQDSSLYHHSSSRTIQLWNYIIDHVPKAKMEETSISEEQPHHPSPDELDKDTHNDNKTEITLLLGASNKK